MIRKMGISSLVGAIAMLGILSVSALAYQEAPELSLLVAAGELPPVEERLPKQPLELVQAKGVDTLIGEYGGVLHLAQTKPGCPALNNKTHLVWAHFGTAASRFCAKIVSIEGIFEGRKWILSDKVYNELAEGTTVEELDGGRVWLLHYREGLKWSDGMLATVDDTMFYVNDVAGNEELTPAGPIALNGEVGGVAIKYEKIDDYTLKVSAPEPFNPQDKWRYFVQAALTYPKHYLSQFHPAYVEKEKLDQMVKDAGLGSWVQLFEQKYDPYGEKGNVGFPVLFPWVIAEPSPAIPMIWKRNPYYFAVDQAGNQLPYIDEIHQIFTGNEDITTLNILAGDVDFAMGINPLAFPLLKDAEDEGKIKVTRWGDGAFNTAQVEFNLTHEDPVMREIFQNKDFRFACSYALDRQMISDILYFGTVKPAQVAPTKGNPYYHERLSNTALDYDPARANKLLDEMGLDKRDADGYRLRSDGETLTIAIITCDDFCENGSKIGELVIDHLRDVGLKVNLRVLDIKIFGELMWGNSHDCFLNRHSWSTGEGGEAWSCHWKIGPGTLWAPLWRKWWKGEEGAETPPPIIIRACELSDQAQKGTMEEKQGYMKEVLDIAADNLWTIGTLERFGVVVTYNPNLRNVPTIPNMAQFGSAELWFYEYE